jgi:hypothetical protein
VVVLRRTEPWPGHGREGGFRWRRLARLGTPVLVVTALLFGAAVSAAVLVGLWSTEASRRHGVETRLEKATNRSTALANDNARLRRQLASSRATSTRLTQQTARLGAAARTLLRENSALLARASRLHDRSGSLERGAASVSRTTATLGNDLVAVLNYITSTDAGSLDPSYLKAQLDYLRPAVASARSAAEALGTEAGSYGTAVDGFATEAQAYAAALQRLASAQR